MAVSLRRFWLIGVVGAALSLGGALGYAWWLNQDQAQRLEVYYGDAQAMFLVPVEDTVVLPPPQKAEAWAQAVFERMRRAPNADVASLVSPEVQLLKAEWRKPTWALQVKLAKGMGSVSESLLAGSLVRTFVGSYPGAEQVELRFIGADGKPYLGQHLDLSRPLTAQDFSNRLDGQGGKGLPATVWWRAAGGDKLVPVQVPLTDGSGSPPRDAFARLVAGPPGEAGSFLQAVVPKGLTPEWGQLEGGVARINLNRDVPAGAAGEAFIEATVLTLTEFSAVQAVQFLRDGLPMPEAVGKYRLAEPIRRPQEVNDAASAATP